MVQGDTLGNFQLERLIRMGCSCQVWEATKLNTDQHYALKVLRPDYHTNKQEIAILKNEFEIASKLTHSNIIRIHEFVQAEEAPFLVMELFSELNLKQILQRGTRALAHGLQDIILKCAESIRFVHESRFIHCQIEPDNFLVSRGGDIRLIDFAFAQKYSPSFFARLFSANRGLCGSLNYRSPEHIRGLKLTPRSDIYSFGCVMFELLTGTPPYCGSSPNERLQKHISAPLPPILDDNVTRAFERIVHKAMAKDPKHRFESMQRLIQALKDVTIFKSPPEPPDAADVLS